VSSCGELVERVAIGGEPNDLRNLETKRAKAQQL
jgi:hypothetical protein